MTETANNNDDETTMDHQPRVRQCVVVLSTFFLLLLLFFLCVRKCFPACYISGGRSTEYLFILSLSLQMAPSIWTSKVFRNLAKTNERTVLRAEVTPGFRQARDIRHRG